MEVLEIAKKEQADLIILGSRCLSKKAFLWEV
ncbi:MAG: hypothetical protein GXY48_04575 [Methanomicrobiales archaeon]|nr:hypothetical protein [Methanomicrobiales archaeon]